MCALRTADRPLSDRPPARLTARDEGQEFRLDPQRHCISCGHLFDVAKVVRWSDDRYEYACLGCAVRFDRKRPPKS